MKDETSQVKCLFCGWSGDLAEADVDDGGHFSTVEVYIRTVYLCPKCGTPDFYLGGDDC